MEEIIETAAVLGIVMDDLGRHWPSSTKQLETLEPTPTRRKFESMRVAFGGSPEYPAGGF